MLSVAKIDKKTRVWVTKELANKITKGWKQAKKSPPAPPPPPTPPPPSQKKKAKPAHPVPTRQNISESETWVWVYGAALEIFSWEKTQLVNPAELRGRGTVPGTCQ